MSGEWKRSMVSYSGTGNRKGRPTRKASPNQPRHSSTLRSSPFVRLPLFVFPLCSSFPFVRLRLPSLPERGGPRKARENETWPLFFPIKTLTRGGGAVGGEGSSRRKKKPDPFFPPRWPGGTGPPAEEQSLPAGARRERGRAPESRGNLFYRSNPIGGNSPCQSSKPNPCRPCAPSRHAKPCTPETPS